MNKVALLSYKQIFGEEKLNIFNKINANASITDFSILLGGFYSIFRTRGWYWIKSNGKYNNFTNFYGHGGGYANTNHRDNGIRPIVSYSKIRNDILYEFTNENGIKEIEYGEYPQYAVDKELQEKLEELYKNNKLVKTGKTYTTDSRKYDEYDKSFLPQEHIEYEFDDKKYVRVKANSCYEGRLFTLSNGEKYRDDDYVWVEVLPIKWLVDKENDVALSKYILVAGIQFNNSEKYSGDFENTNMYKYLNTHFIKDIQNKDSKMDLSKVTGTYEEAMALIEEAKRKTRDILDKSIIGKSILDKDKSYIKIKK